MNPATIIEVLLQNLWPLLPFRIVKSYELGVRWKWGTDPVELKPGFHWVLYVMHSFATVTAAEEMLNLPTQSVVTADGKVICFSANIGRRVTNAVAYYCEVQDFNESLEALAMTHLSRQVRGRKYADVIGRLDQLEKSLRVTTETKCKKWGAEITTIGFTDFVPVEHQVRLFQDKLSMTHLGA